MWASGPFGGTIATTVVRLLAGVAAISAASLLALVIWLDKAPAQIVAVLGAIILGALAVATWLLLNRLARPLDRLALDLAVIGRDNPEHALRIGRNHWLPRLVAAVEGLRQSLLRARQDTASDLAEATARAEEQKRQLEAILLDLSEGIVACNLQHQILLYNQAAASLFESPLALGLGRSLFTVLTQEPILHTIEGLCEQAADRPAVSARFVCATIDGRHLLRARLGLVADAERAASGYVLAMRDAGSELADMAKRDNLLLSATEGLRAPLANLRAAAETLAANPEIAPADRMRFEKIVMEECTTLSDRFEVLARGYRDLGSAQWFMAEIHSIDLLTSLRRRLAGETQSLTVTPIGLPAWLYGDSLSLLVLLEHLARNLHEQVGAEAFDAAVSRAERRVYLDLIWTGWPIAASIIDGWLDTPLVGGLGPLTGRAVLHRHGSDLWSQPGRKGEALLRMPLPSAEPAIRPTTPTRPARPEFYDFDLLNRPLPSGALAERPLRQVSYVVFDVETTGLRPSEGDEVVALAGVRVVNGRVLTMETFDRLVNPGRSIPAESTRFHGITENAVKDKPPLRVLLPQFRSFAADTVLVAHNAAFDLKFINRTAEECSIRFDQPVLDTLLLSAYLDPDEPDHSLDGIANRLGLIFTRRHSALGDCLVTAAILVRLIERLEERGFNNLRELIKATDMAAEIRTRQRQF